MICGILFPSYGHGPKDEQGCHLEVGHDGPHEFIAKNGDTYRWETDWGCDCEECKSGDDWCTIYWKHEQQKGEQQ